ncbi:MAG: acyl-CoA thioesterase [Chitinophagaceae bacterium]
MPRIHVDMPESFSFSTDIPVRITDINYGGHVGNDSLLSILHEARLQYLQSIGCTELDACGIGLIMANAAIIYKGEGFQGDILKIEVTAEELSSRGFVLFYNVICPRNDKNISIAIAQTEMLCFNYETRKVISMPENLKEKLKR